MHFISSAPAPLQRQNKLRIFFHGVNDASTSFPLPIMPFNPRSKSAGAYLSIRLLVVEIKAENQFHRTSLFGVGPR